MKFLSWDRRHCADPTDRRHYKGGGGTPANENSPTTTTTNTDKRIVLQDSIAVTEGGRLTDSSRHTTTTYDNSQRADAEVLKTLAGSMPDAVKAVTGAGERVMRDMGGAIVNLNRDSITANTKSFDAVVSMGAETIDRLIDASVSTTRAGTALAESAVASFMPTDNKNADAMKWAGLAVAAVVGLSILGKAK